MKHSNPTINLIFFCCEPNRMEVVLPVGTVARHSRAHSNKFVLLNTLEWVLLKAGILVVAVPCLCRDLFRKAWLRFTVNSAYCLDLACTHHVWGSVCHARDLTIRQHDTVAPRVVNWLYLLMVGVTEATGIIFHGTLKWLLGICVVKRLVQYVGVR
jgi:hypothetical protein